jgi:hypothetical protein
MIEKLKPLNDMNSIREFYLQNFPTDELGEKINPNATFGGMWEVLSNNGDLYGYIGVGDSLIRERLFEGLARTMGVSYTAIYSQWLMAED